jgi:hypothetical protein
VSSTVIAALVAVAAVAATYFFCIRPMRRGHCGATGAVSGRDAEVDRQIAELREELRVLRAQDSLDSGRVASRPTQPPRDAA